MLATGKAQWTTVCRVVALLALCVPGETSVVVRESSDDAFSSLVHPDVHQHSAVRTSAKDPASIEGGWDANFGVTVDGSSNVLSWWDTTGKGYDVAPMYNTGAPMYSSTGINGHPAVHFENNEHLVSTQTHPSACTPDTSYTWIAVVKMEGTGWENIFSTQDACAQHLNDYLIRGFCIRLRLPDAAALRGQGHGRPQPLLFLFLLLPIRILLILPPSTHASPLPFSICHVFCRVSRLIPSPS
ncbi:unnamed protein product [Prorocentrum cordatum]|uniref:Uncharacterized protein n=1 Tax=Prorocentrum cordatum TaxID=2364126 RepID=A0ABN9YDK3_9DINO|nr:unnamed protein product [Polarella glacialis]